MELVSHYFLMIRWIGHSPQLMLQEIVDHSLGKGKKYHPSNIKVVDNSFSIIFIAI